MSKDWGLAARTALALLTYRIGRVWDALLIAVVPVKEALSLTPEIVRDGDNGEDA